MTDGTKALNALKQMVDQPVESQWKRLQDNTSSMPSAQQAYVMSQENVQKSYEKMMESFNTFLFERFKEDFSAVPAFKPVIDDYIDSVLTTAQEYGKHTVELEQENKKLKQMIEELKNAGRSETK